MIKEHSKTLQTGGGWSVEHLFLKANEFFLFTLFVYKKRVGGQKSSKICLCSF